MGAGNALILFIPLVTLLLVSTHYLLSSINWMSPRTLPFSIVHTLPTTFPDETHDIRSVPLTTQNCDESGIIIYVVDLLGLAGDFTSVQDAVNAVPDKNGDRIVIRILEGLYIEKVRVPSKKTCITLQGEGYNVTTIAWNDTARSANGTWQSASVAIEAANFIARNISFRNTSPAPLPGAVGSQAVALRVWADAVAFYGCGMYSAQDTLYDAAGRHYFKECYIEGSIDFIFGNARSLYEDCELHSIAMPVPSNKRRRGWITGAITAHGRQKAEEETGFSLVGCNVSGTGQVLLGRAWGRYATVVFARSHLSEIIAPTGWNDWNDPSRDQSVFFGEFDCTGLGSDISLRVNYTSLLNDTQATPWLDIHYIDGPNWLPNGEMLIFPRTFRMLSKQ